MSDKTITTSLGCFFGLHKWGDKTLAGDHPRLPSIVRASMEYMNMGYGHACVGCGKIERVQ